MNGFGVKELFSEIGVIVLRNGRNFKVAVHENQVNVAAAMVRDEKL